MLPESTMPPLKTTDKQTYQKQVAQTRQTLDVVDDSTLVGLTSLGVKGIQSLKQDVAEIFPASNLPAFLLQGLIQLEDRVLQPERIEADLTVLFRGTRNIGVYSILAAPALAIHGYQKLLALAGKDVDAAFPDGLWQFYTEFGLREDAARYSVETVGFNRAAPRASDVDAATAWVYAAMYNLLLYDDLLANEWEEHRFFRSLKEVLEEHARAELGRRPTSRKKADAYDQSVAERVAEMEQTYRVAHVAQEWAARRPYSIPSTKPPAKYPAYRRAQFHTYIKQALRLLPADLRQALDQHQSMQREQKQATFQEQMCLLTTLRAMPYQDRREFVPPHKAHIALVAGGNYYLLECCARSDKGDLMVFPNLLSPDDTGVPVTLKEGNDGQLYDCYNHHVRIERGGKVRVDGKRIGRLRPPPLEVVKGQVKAILAHARANPAPAPPATPDDESRTDLLLVTSPRNRQEQLRSLLSKSTQQTIETLRHAPIVINWSKHSSALALGDVRQTQRGCGDHMITLIPTDQSMVFDMSHICFDGVWGMRLAEILTNSATAFYPLVKAARAKKTTKTTAVEPLPLDLSNNATFLKAARNARASAPVEVAVETNSVNLTTILRLRSRLQKIDLPLTVNDMLILSRCVHAATYQPGPDAQRALDTIAALDTGDELRHQIEAHLDEQRGINPALLIPMDATAVEPSLRIFPATFRNPVLELNQHLATCNDLLQQLKRDTDPALVQSFEAVRREFYSDLKTFGALMQSLRDVTMRGESFSVAAMRLLAHLPGPLQSMVNLIPQKIDMLNEIIKGREVFSNVGRVPEGSSLTRFFSSRDDGDTKLLIWGVMTDAGGHLWVTLRDFRPHVAPLVRADRADLAHTLAQDYLDSYANQVNQTVRDIQRIFSYRADHAEENP